LEGYYSRGWSDNIPFSPNGSIVAYPSGENNAATEIRLWDVLDKQPLGNPLSGYNLQYTNTFALDFSPVENLLASASEDQIILWNIADMQPFTIIDHVVNAVSISFSPDGKSLASSSGNSSIILWDVTSGQSKGEPLSAHKGFVSDIEFSPDGSRLASCSREDDMIILWDVSESVTNNEELGWLDEFGTDNLAFSPDRQTLAIGRHGGETDLFNIASQQLVGRLLPGNNGRVSSLAYSPDGQTLATAGKDGDILLWNLDTMQPIGNTLKTGSPTSQQEVAFSPDGKILASSNQDIADSMVLLWDLTASQPESTLLQRNIHFVNCLAFSPDGKILAAGAEGYTLLWDLTSREKIGELWGQDGWIDSLAFSPDGSILATGSDADMIVLWDMASQEPIRDRLWEHKTPISDLAFSPDGTFLASASLDGAIYLWDVASGQPLGESITRADGKDVPVVIAFSADGKTLIMLTQDGILSYLDMNAASWHESLCQRVGRNFTQAEWVSYFPGEPYRKTCEQWPGGE
jgi:WD40 repeat protein